MFERIVTLTPAWDRRDPDPRKNYGIHGVELRMVLKGPEGATQFVVYTNWHLPRVRAEQDGALLRKAKRGTLTGVDLEIRHPLPADVGYHSRRPFYDDQPVMDSDCPYTGGDCYYDGSGLLAEEWFTEKLLTGGSDAIWAALEEEYHARFAVAALAPESGR